MTIQQLPPPCTYKITSQTSTSRPRPWVLAHQRARTPAWHPPAVQDSCRSPAHPVGLPVPGAFMTLSYPQLDDIAKALAIQYLHCNSTTYTASGQQETYTNPQQTQQGTDTPNSMLGPAHVQFATPSCVVTSHSAACLFSFTRCGVLFQQQASAVQLLPCPPLPPAAAAPPASPSPHPLLAHAPLPTARLCC